MITNVFSLKYKTSPIYVTSHPSAAKVSSQYLKSKFESYFPSINYEFSYNVKHQSSKRGNAPSTLQKHDCSEFKCVTDEHKVIYLRSRQ